METLGNADARVLTPRDSEVTGLGCGGELGFKKTPQTVPCAAHGEAYCSLPRCLLTSEDEMKQHVSNGFGNKRRHYVSDLERNTDSRTPVV